MLVLEQEKARLSPNHGLLFDHDLVPYGSLAVYLPQCHNVNGSPMCCHVNRCVAAPVTCPLRKALRLGA